MRVGDARIEHLSLLEQLAAVDKSFGYLQLSDCAMDVAWSYPKIDIKNIAIEEKGKFRIESAISIRRNVWGTGLRGGELASSSDSKAGRNG